LVHFKGSGLKVPTNERKSVGRWMGERRREKRWDRRRERTGTSNEKFAHLFAFDVSERRMRWEEREEGRGKLHNQS